jgi:hypothetical protein
MSSYLEAYGAAEEHHAKRIRTVKIVFMSVAALLVLGLILYSALKNRSEENQVKTFLALLQEQDYSGAYRLWGCTDAAPCPNYPMKSFMEDFGPQSPHADESSAHIGLTQACGSGVLLRVDYPHAEAVPLWVQRKDETIGFAPPGWEECPGRHLHFGAWLHSLFGK